MKVNHEVFGRATRITLVLFGIVPAIGFMLFGDMDLLASWIEIDLILGVVFFLSYLVFGSLSKKETRLQ